MPEETVTVGSLRTRSVAAKVKAEIETIAVRSREAEKRILELRQSEKEGVPLSKEEVALYERVLAAYQEDKLALKRLLGQTMSSQMEGER